MMKEWMLYMLVCVSICWMLYYIYGGHKNPFQRCFLKTISSFCFVFIAAISLYFHTSSVYYIMMLGLVLGMLGDILLDLAVCYPRLKQWYFLAGLSSFLLGHIAYTMAFSVYGIDGKEIIICFVLAFLCIQWLQHVSCVFQAVKIPVYLYGTVILCMVCQSVKLLWLQNTWYSLLICGGALLFAISDLILAFLLFQDRYHRPSWTWANLTTYYMAQMFFACSLYIA